MNKQAYIEGYLSKEGKKKPTTKKGKQDKMHTVMSEYKAGTLRSGSKDGPKVTSRQQAIAIGMSESGQDKEAKDPEGGVAGAMHPTAGENAPPGVQHEISNYREMPSNYREKMPLLYHLLGEGTPDYKMSKEDAQYAEQTPVKGQTCANCKYAYQNVPGEDYICSKIEGHIEPQAWCKLWAPLEE